MINSTDTTLRESRSAIKTYFPTNQLHNWFPSEFIESKNKKYIIVQHCRAILNKQFVGDVMVHCSFVKRNAYLDSFVCLANETLTKYKKYEYNHSDTSFDVWFTDMNGNRVSVDAFVLQLMLIY